VRSSLKRFWWVPLASGFTLLLGACHESACKKSGTECISSDSCCDGLGCLSGTCTSDCKGAGQGCTGNNECCSGAFCRNGICGPNCGAAGESCGPGGGCCAHLNCQSGTCACGAHGDACDSNLDCCGTLSCDPAHHLCVALSCLQVPQSCVLDSECCSSHCNDHQTCCKPDAEPCETAGECCGTCLSSGACGPCVANGQAAPASQDCCANASDGGFCCQKYGACSNAADCCGTCYADGGSSNCRNALGGPCYVDADCLPGLQCPSVHAIEARCCKVAGSPCTSDDECCRIATSIFMCLDADGGGKVCTQTF